ncbi:hypothetical protein pipiens_013607 [Culex pipiens pipiens]|uniref:Uncharacterized protein n=1 Tax=Culex pipiens pipiens TaxID=38569 RepID=A0ABD1CXV0_CULPP
MEPSQASVTASGDAGSRQGNCHAASMALSVSFPQMDDLIEMMGQEPIMMDIFPDLALWHVHLKRVAVRFPAQDNEKDRNIDEIWI